MSSITNQPDFQPQVPYRPLHNVLNSIEGMRKSGILKGEFGTRAANLVVAAPTELSAVATNILLSPVQVAGVILGLGARAVAYISGIQAVKDFQQKMPTVTDFLRTVARIVAFSIGTSLSATVGVVSPKQNFKLHVELGLIRNKKADDAAQLAQVNKIAQDALAIERKEQIEADVKEVEQLPHEEAVVVTPAIEEEVVNANLSDSTMAYGKVSSKDQTEESTGSIVADSEEDVASSEEEEVAASKEEEVATENEWPFAEMELSSEEEVAATEVTVNAPSNSKLATIKAKLIDAKDLAVAHKYKIAGTVATAAAVSALVMYTDVVSGVTFVGGTIVNGASDVVTYAASGVTSVGGTIFNGASDVVTYAAGGVIGLVAGAGALLESGRNAFLNNLPSLSDNDATTATVPTSTPTPASQETFVANQEPVATPTENNVPA